MDHPSTINLIMSNRLRSRWSACFIRAAFTSIVIALGLLNVSGCRRANTNPASASAQGKESKNDGPWIKVGEHVELNDLYAYLDTPDSRMIMREDEKRVYRIEPGESGDCIASWRQCLYLPRGTYCFSVEHRGEGIRPREGEDGSSGAVVTIAEVDRPEGRVGTFDWLEATYCFNVLEDNAEVQLISELRATSGWLEMRSPIVMRMPD